MIQGRASTREAEGQGGVGVGHDQASGFYSFASLGFGCQSSGREGYGEMGADVCDSDQASKLQSKLKFQMFCCDSF